MRSDQALLGFTLPCSTARVLPVRASSVKPTGKKSGRNTGEGTKKKKKKGFERRRRTRAILQADGTLATRRVKNLDLRTGGVCSNEKELSPRSKTKEKFHMQGKRRRWVLRGGPAQGSERELLIKQKLKEGKNKFRPKLSFPAAGRGKKEQNLTFKLRKKKKTPHDGKRAQDDETHRGRGDFKQKNLKGNMARPKRLPLT